MEGSKTNIRVKVLPRSSKNQIVGQENGTFKVKLTAPPVEGKANKALSDLLTKRLGLPRGSVEIVSGKRSRLKSVRIKGLSSEEVKDLLNRES
jgi:uncharacterized protein (TIGR00251 family)